MGTKAKPCGRICVVHHESLTRAATKSCGCLRKDNNANVAAMMFSKPRLPVTVHGGKDTSDAGKKKQAGVALYAARFRAWLAAGSIVCCENAPECLAEGKCRGRL